MFTRVKTSRHGEYLQIVENYRDEGKVRQRLVLYVGHYASIDDALRQMPQERRRWRRAATRTVNDARGDYLRSEAAALDARLNALQQLVDEHPHLLERDRQRAERHQRRQAERARARREAWSRARSDQHRA